MSLVMRLKGHNAIVPCRLCKIVGVKAPEGKTYYVPHDRRGFRGASSVDPASLDLRKHMEMLSQARDVQTAGSVREQSELAKLYGINGLSILSYLPSLRWLTSFPYDFMHLIWENLIPNLVLFWTGAFKGLDDGKETITIDKDVFAAIGAATARAGSTIPSAYGARVPDIDADRSYFSAEMWSFWTLYLGPVLLHRCFKDERYYDHFIRLVKLLNICLQFEISEKDIETIQVGFTEWVETYEKLYYQYNPARVSACPLTVHALLHIADSIKAEGPVWCYWAFPMERYCGTLKNAIQSRRFPYASLDRFVIESAQLTHIGVLYDMTDKLTLLPPRRGTPANCFSAPEYPSCILLGPRSKSPLERGLEMAVIGALITRFTRPAENLKKQPRPPKVTPEKMCRIIRTSHTTITRYGRVRRVDSDAGDTIMASALIRHASIDRRDATFVRGEAIGDLEAHHGQKDEQLAKGTFYGQLEHLIVLQFGDGVPEFGLQRDSTIIFAAVRECILMAIPAALRCLDFHFYEKTGKLHILDVTTVQCLVGRVLLDHGTWAIVDRSGSLARAVWDDSDDREEDLELLEDV